MKLEKEIENEILCFLNEIGIFAWKNQSVGIYDERKKCYRRPKNRHHIKGVSDIIGILPSGRFIGIEVKSESGRASEDQLKFITRANDRNGLCFISRSVEQTYDEIEKHWPGIQDFRHILNKYIQLGL